MQRPSDRRRRAVILVVAVATMVSAACSSSEPFDRERAIEQARVAAPDDATDDQLGCYVDRVAAELGPDLLDPQVRPTTEQIRPLVELRMECLGVASLGLVPPAESEPPIRRSDGSTLPWDLGDDPELDQLHRACADANLVACDELFDVATPGSPYERFGATCGERAPQERCAPGPDPGS